MKTLLLRTAHGSRLYGLHRPDSDYDWFEVYGYDKGRSKQKITGDQDVIRTSLDSFLWNCNNGVPQYLEAMFSQQCEVNEISFLTETFRPSIDVTRITYKRTIKKLWFKGVEESNIKFKRHAVRLAMNLAHMQKYGRFDPTLDDTAVIVVKNIAEISDFEEFEATLDLYDPMV